MIYLYVILLLLLLLSSLFMLSRESRMLLLTHVLCMHLSSRCYIGAYVCTYVCARVRLLVKRCRNKLLVGVGQQNESLSTISDQEMFFLGLRHSQLVLCQRGLIW